MSDSLPPESININRHERQRRDLGDLTSLKSSIARNGVLNPIIITEDNELIAGERRLTACLELGLSSIPVRLFSSLSPTDRQIIELAENVQRKDLEWKEEVDTCARIHGLYKDQDPAWTLAQTAEELGMSEAGLRQRLDIADQIAAGNVKVQEAKKLSEAATITARVKNRQQDVAVEDLTTILSPQIDDETTTTPKPSGPFYPCKNIDFTLFIKREIKNKFNFIHCDFPYGIDADKMNQSAASTMESYDDSFATYARCLDGLESAMSTIVADNAHLMFWFSLRHYTYTLKRLTAMGWKVLHTPLIWHKSDNTGMLPDPRRGPRWNYETAFHCTRGDRFIAEPVSNIVSSPAEKSTRIHMSQKPRSMLAHFFRLYIDETTRMFDPTAGSGTSLQTAFSMGAKYVYGTEVDAEIHALAAAEWGRFLSER